MGDPFRWRARAHQRRQAGLSDRRGSPLRSWRLRTRSDEAGIEARFEAPSSSFVGLVYDNPPGGAKTCLNSKLAACELRVELPGQPVRTLRSKHRAAFEILTERTDHGIAVVA